MHIWCRLILQAAIYLNMLRHYQQNPTILAHIAIESPFNFNKTPLIPPGIKVLVYEKLNHRKTWGIHGVPG